MIQLTQVKPDPIYDSGKNPSSDIWATECTFEKGKKYLITAPSGKGKSTLLHLIYGLRKDYQGQIEIAERAVKDFQADDWSELRQKHLSIVFQDLRLFPKLSAFANIELKNSLAPKKSETEIRDMAAKLGVADLLDKPCSTLSYGQRQRIAIIRALCQPFDYLMLDEPFSHLDLDNIRIASELIHQELEDQQAALLLVSLGDKYDFSYNKELLL